MIRRRGDVEAEIRLAARAQVPRAELAGAGAQLRRVVAGEQSGLFLDQHSEHLAGLCVARVARTDEAIGDGRQRRGIDRVVGTLNALQLGGVRRDASVAGFCSVSAPGLGKK